VKRIAVLTSGGDCSGMNAVIRAVTRVAQAMGIEVLGIRKGYKGLLGRDFEALTSRSISNTLQRGGTFLQSARCTEMLEEAGQKKAADILQGLGIEGLVVIGGDGSLRGARSLHRHGVNVIGIPASIDNDIPFTDISLGVDTALNNVVYAVDCLKDTASSHDRAFVVEVMGRNCGYLTLAAAITCGAEHALIPEAAYDLEAICRNLRKRYLEGRSNSIIMVAEGVAKAHRIAEQIQDCGGFETRLMVLGHYQRGGSPSHFDRLLGSRFGQAAVEFLQAGRGGGVMIGLDRASLKLTPLDEVLDTGSHPIDPDMLKLAGVLVG